MPDVLPVSTGQFRHPITDLILVKADNSLFHLLAIVAQPDLRI